MGWEKKGRPLFYGQDQEFMLKRDEGSSFSGFGEKIPYQGGGKKKKRSGLSSSGPYKPRALGGEYFHCSRTVLEKESNASM